MCVCVSLAFHRTRHEAGSGGAWLIAILVIGLSGVWPFVKLGMLLYAWLAPASMLQMSRRSEMLIFLDEYGKYSLVDSWLAILALCAFDIKWSSDDVAINVTPVPMLPFFTFVIASVLSLILGHIATVFNRRALAAADTPVRSLSRELRDEERLILFRVMPSGEAFLLLGLSIFTALALPVACILTSIEYEVSGVLAELLLTEEEMNLSYSLVSLGHFLTAGFEASSGLRAVQVIFFAFTLAIPWALSAVLLALLLLPLSKLSQSRLLKVCHVLDAWAAFDVFVVAVVVANFEFWLLTQFLMYHDNIATACNWVHENLDSECLAMQCHVRPGFILMALAGAASYATPKMFFHWEGLVEDRELSTSDSEEESLQKL